MKRPTALLLATLLVCSPFSLAAAQEKPVAALGRVATLGEVSEAQKKIIINRLEAFLSKTRSQTRRSEDLCS